MIKLAGLDFTSGYTKEPGQKGSVLESNAECFVRSRSLGLQRKKILILASNSPRRKQIFTLGGWNFHVVPADVNEDPTAGEDPRYYVRRLAEEKARTAAQSSPPGSVIVGADTTVVCQTEYHTEEILGKPASPKEAAEMLLKLRDGAHYVYTAIAVMDRDSGNLESDICSTEVYMRPYTQAEIDIYVASGDPMDKAGAYAIQDKAFHPVDRLRGCYPNVVGLPLCRLAAILGRFDIPIQTQVTAACQQDDSECLVYRLVLQSEG
jgi:septum formation protein